MSLTWRALALSDVPAVTAVLNAAAEADGTGQQITETQLTEDFNTPGFDLADHSIGLWHGSELVGLGTVFGRPTLVEGQALVTLQGDLQPQHRSWELAAALLDRLEGRGRHWAQQRYPGEPIRLRASGGLADSDRQQLLEKYGYRADNYFLTMQVDLATWTDPGTATSAVAPEASALEAVREAHNDAFRDHRNHSPVPADQWVHWSTSSSLRIEQCRVVIDQGRVLAYALATEDQPGVLHVGLVGTRREARGRGLAKDVLIASLRAAGDGGFSISELEVDQTSPTGADRLYRAVGYVPVRVLSRYTRDVPPAPAAGSCG